MERTSRQFTIPLPPEMAEQVIAAAKAESRTVSELFREAFRTYRAHRVYTLLEKSQGEGRRRKHQGYTEGDVERLIHDVRAEDSSRAVIVVLDSNVGVSALEFGGTPGLALTQALTVDLLAISDFIEREVMRVLTGKFNRDRGELQMTMREDFVHLHIHAAKPDSQTVEVTPRRVG